MNQCQERPSTVYQSKLWLRLWLSGPTIWCICKTNHSVSRARARNPAQRNFFCQHIVSPGGWIWTQQCDTADYEDSSALLVNCKKVLFFKRSQVKTVYLKNKLSRIFWFLKRSSAATFPEKKLFDIFWRKVKNAFVFFLMQHIFVPLVVNLSFEAQPSFFLTKILGM